MCGSEARYAQFFLLWFAKACIDDEDFLSFVKSYKRCCPKKCEIIFIYYLRIYDILSKKDIVKVVIMGIVSWDFRAVLFTSRVTIDLGQNKNRCSYTVCRNSFILQLKKVIHEILNFKLSSWISSSRASEYPIRAVANFPENSRRYSRMNAYRRRCQRHRR